MASCGAPHEVCVCVRACVWWLCGGESGFQEAHRRSPPTLLAKRVDFVVVFFVAFFFFSKCHTAAAEGGSRPLHRSRDCFPRKMAPK